MADFCDLYSLQEAWLAVRRKGARGGIDGVSVQTFAAHADEALAELSRVLSANEYVPEPYERIVMYKKGSAPRPLGLPTIKDKIVQMAVRNAIEPVFNTRFADCSYAYRPGKGHRKAIRRVEHYLSQGNVWVSTCDIDKFFDSLDHEIVLEAVSEKIQDPRILRLLKLWLKIGIVHRDEYHETDKGVPQGGIISPLLSNIYLDSFDQYLLELGYNLVRYADDFITPERQRQRAESAHRAARAFLESRLKLRLNPLDKTVWNVQEGFVFLGLYFKGQRRTIARDKFNKARYKIEDIVRRGAHKPLPDIVEEVNESVNSWRYYYSTADTAQQFAELESFLHQKLMRLVRERLGKKQVSRAEAQQALNRLNFLLPKKASGKRKFVRTILQGKRAPASTQSVGASVPTQSVGTRGRSKRQAVATQSKGTRSVGARGAGDGTAKGMAKQVSDAVIKRQIRQKKKKYQRLQAESTELVVTTPYCSIGKLHQRVVVRQHGTILQQISTMKLKHILITTKKVSLSTDVIQLCGEARIPIDLINIKGQLISRLSHPDFPQKTVGLAQLQAFGNGKAQILARTIVEAKVRNQLNLMKYFHKYRKQVDEAFDALFDAEEARMESYLDELKQLRGEWSLDEGRGKLFAIEGRAASSYWRLVQELVKDEVPFEKRIRRGATDLFNSLLNYGYGILYARIWGAVLRAGLNPTISYLHTEQPNKPTLVFDLIEEFRAQAVDRVVITLIGRKEQVNMAGKFLSTRTRNKLLQNVLERLNMPFIFRDKEMSLAQIINSQAKAFARFLQGKKGKYWPFIGKW